MLLRAGEVPPFPRGGGDGDLVWGDEGDGEYSESYVPLARSQATLRKKCRNGQEPERKTRTRRAVILMRAATLISIVLQVQAWPSPKGSARRRRLNWPRRVRPVHASVGISWVTCKGSAPCSVKTLTDGSTGGEVVRRRGCTSKLLAARCRNMRKQLAI